MLALPTIPQSVATYAVVAPDKLAAHDSHRSLTYRQWEERANRLANALLGLGLCKGDRVAILAYNCIEWMEIYVALGIAGLIAVPINFRLTPKEIRYIVDDCGATAFVVQDELADRVEEIRDDLDIQGKRYVSFGASTTPSHYQSYELLIAASQPHAPSVEVMPTDSWAIMYTSGTTGKPKGAIRSHGSQSAVGPVVAYDMGFARDDTGLLVMPMCHVNSFYLLSAFAVIGGTSCVYDRKSFDPEHLLRTLAAQGATFTSLVPTHYIMMLGLSAAVKARCDVSRVRKLLISSAPARRETKLAIMDYFGSSQLFEGYGSTEAGFVTLLRPDEQLTHLGSIGREMTCTGRLRLLDDNGVDVPEGEPGELFSHTPFVFDGYWNQPEKTAEAFRGKHCTVGDMARHDEQGFYYLVDRKSNMIISGGENVYPSEVEGLLGQHPSVKDVAVIGIPHEKWGESVHAVVITHDDYAVGGDELLEWCRTRIAGYKRPRSLSFIHDEEMPRTATGKILHRVLRDRMRQAP
jgi:fatty-acyl-CoA synthase